MLTGCVTVLEGLKPFVGGAPAAPAPAPSPTPAPSPAAWLAPLPHEGRPTELLQWWAQFDDPQLVSMIESAQAVSPGLAAARSRIEQARAASTAAAGGRLPQVDATGSATRGRSEAGGVVASVAQLGLQSSWELDLFGAVRAGVQAGEARLEGAQAAWHVARVAVAAEVASVYLALRACEAQLQELEIDVQSRAETARATERSAQAGVTAPAAAAQARASAAQGRAQAVAQRAQCDNFVKALVALTAGDEAALRPALAAGAARIPQAAPIAFTSLPAQLLAQRPDLTEAAANVTAAAADVRLAEARQRPRVALSGSLGLMSVSAAGIQREGSTFSLGPLQVSFPVFDAGVRRANEQAARAAYDESVAAYQARLRTAVREVEEALVQLRASRDRQADALTAAEGFEASFKAAEARYKGGVASIFELEDARRTAVAARSALVDLQRERTAAWIALYRALGGGWKAGAAAS
ncbi:MAG: efflux transporter outer membrane subunit [Rubrivivax sp.]|nr:efflux transporter outer membrane subunit [Rubrivivax sp.]